MPSQRKDESAIEEGLVLEKFQTVIGALEHLNVAERERVIGAVAVFYGLATWEFSGVVGLARR